VEFLIALPVLLFSMVAHEYAHGYAALRQGDPTAMRLGRLTLNPVKHIDPVLTILMPVALFFGTNGQVIFGGAKPVPVDPRNYRNFRRGDLIVSSAGIVTNVALAVVCSVAVVAVGALGQAVGSDATSVLAVVQRACYWGVWLNLLLAFFNLIPIPPLDGSRLLVHALPPAAATAFHRVSRYGVVVLLAVVIFLPEVLWTALTPAFAAQGAVCAVAEPFELRAFPLCR
jgi:Zn-dependent protease